RRLCVRRCRARAGRGLRAEARQPRDDYRRERAEVLCLGPTRHPSDRRAEGRRAGHRQPDTGQGGEEQARRSVPGDGVRHLLRPRRFACRRGDRSRRRGGDPGEERSMDRVRVRASRERAGGIRRIGEEYGWIVDALAAIALACGWSEERAAAIERLADRLTHGVREDAVAVAKIRARGVRRAFLRRLVDAGFRTRDELRAADPEVLRAVLRNKAALAALTAALARRGPAPRYEPAAAAACRAADSETPAPESAAGPVLTVNLPERRVVYRGVDIPTRPPRHLHRQPLLALAVLAEHAGKPVTVAALA